LALPFLPDALPFQCIKRIEEMEVTDPNLDPQLVNLKGVCKMRTAKVIEALELFDKVLKADPGNGEAVANRKGAIMLKANLDADAANKEFRAGDYMGALKTYESVDLTVASAELKFQVKNNMGAIYMQLKRVPEALKEFDAALEVQPLSVDTIHNKATALKGVGRMEEAMAAFDQCLAAQPDFYSAMCGKIETLNALSRFPEAIIVADAAIKAKPDEYRAYADRGFSNLKQHKIDEAIKDFEGAMNHGSKQSGELMKVYALALILKADSLLNTARYSEASEMYEKALSLGDADRPSAGVLFNHSLALLHSGKKEESMLEMEHCVEVDPSFFSAWAAMGLTHLQNGRFSKAIHCLENATKIKPEEVEVGYHLGVSYLKSNDLEAAVEQFKKVLQLNPNHETSQRALALLESSLAYKNKEKAQAEEAERARVAEVEARKAAEEEVKAKKVAAEAKVAAEKAAKEVNEAAAVAAAKAAEEAEEARVEAARVAAEKKALEEATPPPPPTEEQSKLQGAFEELTIGDATPVAVTKAYRGKTVDEGEIGDALMEEVDGDACLIQMDFEMEELIYPGPYPKGIRVDRREQYLPDELFRSMFYELRKWRQVAKKKEAGLW